MSKLWLKVCFVILIVQLFNTSLTAQDASQKPSDVESSKCILMDSDTGANIAPKWPHTVKLKEIDDIANDGTELATNIIATSGVSIDLMNIQPNSNNKTYVKATLDQIPNNTTYKQFSLKLTTDFEDYLQYETEAQMTINVYIQCDNSQNLQKYTFIQPIKDTSSNKPQFENVPYEFTIPMPFPKGTDLIPFGKPIVVKDINLSNQEITFTILSNETSHIEKLFSISSVADSTNKKLYSAQIKSEADLLLENDVEMILQAQNTAKKMATEKITIKINKAASLPKFDSNIYVADCVNCTSLDNEILKFDKTINLIQGNDETVKLLILHEEKEIQDIFKVNKTEDGVITVTRLAKLPNNFTLDSVTLKLQANKPGATAETTLYIKLAKNEPTSNVESSSNGGLLAATIILSLLLVGFIIAAAYFYNKHRANYSDSLMS